MEYFLVRYDSRVVIYDRRGFIRLATGVDVGGRCLWGNIWRKGAFCSQSKNARLLNLLLKL